MSGPICFREGIGVKDLGICKFHTCAATTVATSNGIFVATLAGSNDDVVEVTATDTAGSESPATTRGPAIARTKGTYLFSDGLGDAEHFCVERFADAHETGVTLLDVVS